MENTVEALRQRFEASESTTFNARQVSHRCRDYYDGYQLSEEETRELRKRGQPPVVINRIRRKMDWLRGLEMQSRTDPRAFPRTPDHEQGAEAATDSIRYVCDNVDWDRTRSKVWEQMLVEGIGGVEIIHKARPPRRDPEIEINFYPFDRLFYDPHSRESDFSDARYKGAVIWADVDQLSKQYPKMKDGFDSLITETNSDTYGDKPSSEVWADRDRRRVRIVLMYYMEGDVWKWAKFTRGDILEDGESPYRDEHGESECPLIMQSAYVDRENQRYGVVKDMLDVQDEINKRRSKSLHLLNSRQTIGEKGAVDSIAAMKREMAKADGHIEVAPEMRFERMDTNDLSQGQFALLQEAKSEIDLMGANAGLSGKEDGQQSGRAIMAKQQGGMIEVAPLTDGLSHFTRAVYRAIWSRIRQYWTEEKWIRVTDDERNVRFVGINTPVTLIDKLSQMPPEQVRQFAMQNGLYEGDPRLGQVVARENEVASLDVDIILEEVQDAVTLQGETFEQLVNLATSMPGAIPPEILIESMPNLKRDIKDKLLERFEQQQAQQAQAGQAQSQVEGQKAQSDGMKAQASASKDMAQAQKFQVETQRLAMGY